jgi:hypothetical protein
LVVLKLHTLGALSPAEQRDQLIALISDSEPCRRLSGRAMRDG